MGASLPTPPLEPLPRGLSLSPARRRATSTTPLWRRAHREHPLADYELLHAAAARLDREAVPDDATDRVALLAATYRLRVLGARSLLRMGLPDLAFRVLDGDWPTLSEVRRPPCVERLSLVTIRDELAHVRDVIDSIVGTANPLTDRQTRVVALLADGLSLEQAASRLHVTRDTVKRTVERAFAATGTHRQPHLVAVALRGRWIA